MEGAKLIAVAWAVGWVMLGAGCGSDTTAGEPGAMGTQGAMGARGAVGPQGAEGPPGPEGPAGPTGTQGPGGAGGAQGQEGAAGKAGPPGQAGADGQMGLAGATGPAGAKGAAGAMGPVGPVGPAGPAGTAGAAGLLTGHGSIYSVTSSVVEVAGNSSGTAAAECSDAKDILLNGGCSINLAYGALGASYPMYQNGRTVTHDTWWCAAVDNSSIGIQLTAYATCITGP